jgi:hypothetical protein
MANDFIAKERAQRQEDEKVWKALFVKMGMPEPMLWPQIGKRGDKLSPLGDQAREEELRDIISVMNKRAPNFGTDPRLILAEIDARLKAEPSMSKALRTADKDWQDAKAKALATMRKGDHLKGPLPPAKTEQQELQERLLGMHKELDYWLDKKRKDVMNWKRHMAQKINQFLREKPDMKHELGKSLERRLVALEEFVQDVLLRETPPEKYQHQPIPADVEELKKMVWRYENDIQMVKADSEHAVPTMRAGMSKKLRVLTCDGDSERRGNEVPEGMHKSQYFRWCTAFNRMLDAEGFNKMGEFY